MQPLRCALVVQPLIIAAGNAKRGTGNLGTRTSVPNVECSTAQKTWTESATVLDVQTARTHGVLCEVCSHRIEHGRLCTDGFHRTLLRFQKHEFAFRRFIAMVSGATLLVGSSNPGLRALRCVHRRCLCTRSRSSVSGFASPAAG